MNLNDLMQLFVELDFTSHGAYGLQTIINNTSDPELASTRARVYVGIMRDIYDSDPDFGTAPQGDEESIAKVIIDSTAYELELLIVLNDRRPQDYKFDAATLAEIRKIPNLEQKKDSICSLVKKHIPGDTSRVLDFARRNDVEDLTTAKELSDAIVPSQGFHYLSEMVCDPVRAQKYLSLGPEDRCSFLELDTSMGILVHKLREVLTNTPTADLQRVFQAYEFAKNEKAEELFYKNLGLSYEQGTVGKWAASIIEHFRKDAIGGSNYRSIVEVLQ